ncbi:MAG: hypothetical protein AB8B87_15380 [Granulosicoccus sp.]
MTFESDKTGRHLRAKALHEGSEERMRALQALSHGYGVGSQAALAKLLLATLGGSGLSDEGMATEGAVHAYQNATAATMQVAQPMQSSANDTYHPVKEATIGA